MQIAVEFTAESVVPVFPGSRFVTWASVNEQPIPDSAGKDTYQQDALILKGKRVTALGRLHNAAFGALETVPGKPCLLDYKLGHVIRIHLESNTFADQGLLAVSLAMRFLDGRGRLISEIPLTPPAVEIEWRRRGAFAFRPHCRS